MQSSEFPYTACHHACQASSFTSIPHQIDTLIFNKPTMIHNYQRTSAIYIRIVFSIGFVKYIMTCSSPLQQHQSNFTAQKVLCALHTHLPPPATTGNHSFFNLIFYWEVFLFQRVIQLEAYTVSALSSCLLSLSNMYFHFFHVFFCGVITHFFLALKIFHCLNVPVYLSIHLLKDILVASKSGQI